MFYQAASSCGDADRMREARRRIGARLGAQAEERGNLYSNEGLYELVADDRCRRYGAQVGEGMKSEFEMFGFAPGTCQGERHRTINPNASAFAWYQATGNAAEADRLMVKFAKSKPGDLEVFRRAAGHFRNREQSGDSSGDKQNPQHLAELRRISIENARGALAQEEQEYARKVVDAGGSLAERSMARLREARQWFAFYAPADIREIRARAERRGDELAGSADALSLRQALTYFDLAENTAKAGMVRSRARDLGDAASKKGNLAAAGQLYAVAGDTKRVEETGRRAGAQAEQAQRKLMKDEKQQRQFRKEQDELERQLGL
jgi:hypothetical protein